MCHHHSNTAHGGYHAGHRAQFGKWGRAPFFAASQTQAPVNIVRKTDLYELELHLAGKSREDFTIGLSGLELTIAYKGQESSGSDRQWTRREYNPGSFERVFQLDDTIDLELITARYDNGVLIVLLPIKPESQVMRQEIKIG